MGDGEKPSLPGPHTAADLDFAEHEFVCTHCVHRRHETCEQCCSMCNSACLCPCRRWRIPMRGNP